MPYYVKTDFLSNYRNKIAQIEHQVEDEYISQLRMKCYKERNDSMLSCHVRKQYFVDSIVPYEGSSYCILIHLFHYCLEETALWRARTFGDADLWNRAQRMATPSCDRLQEIYS